MQLHVSMYRDIHTLQPYIIDFTQRGCHTLRCIYVFLWISEQTAIISQYIVNCFCNRHDVCLLRGTDRNKSISLYNNQLSTSAQQFYYC